MEVKPEIKLFVCQIMQLFVLHLWFWSSHAAASQVEEWNIAITNRELQNKSYAVISL